MKTFAFLTLAFLVLSTSAKPQKMSYSQVMKAKSIQCDVCTFIVTELDNVLVADQTEQELINQVEKICTAIDGLLSGLGATCNTLVETYLPQIIEGLVENQLSPSSVCGTLTLC